MSPATYYVGDVHRALAVLPDQSVDLVLTSPPFLALRSYLPAEHPDKALEIGSEASPGQYIDALLDVVEALDRVLAPHGSIVIELGDTYAGSGGAGGDYDDGGLREGQNRFSARRATDKPGVLRPPGPSHRAALLKAYSSDDRSGHYNGRQLRPYGTNGGDGWPLDKSLCLIPELFRFSLVYGFNPLTGRQTPRWRARNVMRWCRPNPPVGALGDKFRPATTEMIVATKAKARYFDLDSVRRPPTAEPQRRFSNEWGQRGGDEKAIKYGDNYLATEPSQFSNPAGVPPLDFLTLDGIDPPPPKPARPRRLGGHDTRDAAQEKVEGWKAGPHRDSGNPNGPPPLDWVESMPGPPPRGRSKYRDVDYSSNNPHTNWAPEHAHAVIRPNPKGPPPLDWQRVSTQSYEGAHYATWPERLCEIPIESMCPLKVCTVCGEPSRRIAETVNAVGHAVQRSSHRASPYGAGDGRVGVADINKDAPDVAERVTIGWTHCGCGHGCRPTTWKVVLIEVEQYRLTGGKWVDADEWEGGEPDQVRTRHQRKRVVDDMGECRDPSHWRAGMVLDPFAGSGTTLAVASGHGRDAIGIDLDERNAEMALERVGGLFLTVETVGREEAPAALVGDQGPGPGWSDEWGSDGEQFPEFLGEAPGFVPPVEGLAEDEGLVAPGAVVVDGGDVDVPPF
jgi:DNA methylase